MHQLALTDGSTSLHAWHVAWPIPQIEAGHASGNRARSNDQVFVLRQVELIDHAAQQINVNLPAGGNQAGTDFNDHSHKFSVRLPI